MSSYKQSFLNALEKVHSPQTRGQPDMPPDKVVITGRPSTATTIEAPVPSASTPVVVMPKPVAGKKKESVPEPESSMSEDDTAVAEELKSIADRVAEGDLNGQELIIALESVIAGLNEAP